MALRPDFELLSNIPIGVSREDEVQLDLFGDYRNNVAAYREFQAYFRKH